MQQPLFLHKNTRSTLQSFVIRHAEVPHLYNHWHYHKEIELLYVVRSSGTRFVGDSIQPFFDRDMVLIGSNVPHFWQNDEPYFQPDSQLTAEVVLLQFEENFIGEILALPEMMHIRQLLARAMYGIQFTGTTRDLAHQLLFAMAEDERTNKVVALLQLLDLFARTEQYQLLSQLGNQMKLPAHTSERIQQVCAYLLQHYRNPITLEEVAAVASMSEKAFCRFFKKSTQKTLVQFVNELRVNYACKRLRANERTIGEICYESGFNNLSNFNRAFKQTTGQTPREYQKSLPFAPVP